MFGRPRVKAPHPMPVPGMWNPGIMKLQTVPATDDPVDRVTERDFDPSHMRLAAVAIFAGSPVTVAAIVSNAVVRLAHAVLVAVLVVEPIDTGESPPLPS
jgi:hypothetical protein